MDSWTPFWGLASVECHKREAVSENIGSNVLKLVVAKKIRCFAFKKIQLSY